MKKTFLIAVLFLFSKSFINAQNAATPNAGFENWTQFGNYFDPNGWNTLNPNTAILGVFTCLRATGADVHSGSYAIKLTTKSVFGVTANGITSTGTLITTPPYGVTGGIPFTLRPDSITGWYKYSPAGNDSGFVQFSLFDAAGDTVGYVRWIAVNQLVSSYTRFSKPVAYFSAATPVTSQWLLSSSRGSNQVVNSSIYIDDLNLIFNSTAIQNTIHSNSFVIANTIADNVLKVSNNTAHKAQLAVMDAAGKFIQQYDLRNSLNNLNMQDLKSGIYFYRVQDLQDHTFIYGKIIKCN